MRQEKAKKRSFTVATVPATIFLLYTLYTTLFTWCDGIGFLAGVEVPFYLLGALMTVACVAILSHVYTIRFRKYNSHSLLWLYALFIFGVTFFRGLIPDTGFDTLNYHLLSQEAFRNGFEGNCAPGNFQIYGFALGDKLYALPRLLFGYRAGSMFSGVVLCLILYQVSELLHLLCGMRLAALRKRYFSGPITKYLSFVLREETWAFLAVFVHDAVMLLGSYYVELYAVVFLLEAVYQLVCQKEPTSEDAILFILCVGFLFAIKMTNIVYLLPLVILYLIKIRRILTPALFFVCLAIGFFPCAPYLLIDWVVYANPVFPYFNKLFQSPYFPLLNFKDGRFGPQTVVQVLLWPLYMIFAPGNRQSEIPMTWTGGLAAGMAATLLVVLVCVWNLVRNKRVRWDVACLAIITVVSFALWEVTTSISRYYIGGYILLNCLCVWFTVQYLLRKKWWKILLSCLCSVALLLQSASAFDEYLDGWEWSWRKVSVQSISENVGYLFRDRALQDTDPHPDAYFAVDFLAGLSQSLLPETPIYNMEYLYNTLGGKEQERLLAETEKWLDGGNAYLLSNSNSFGADFIEKMNQYGLYADSISVVHNRVYETLWDSLQLHVVSMDEGQSNVLYTTPFTMESNGASHLTAQGYGGETVAGLYLQLQDDAGNEIVSVPISEDGTVALSVDLPPTAGDTLIWTLTDSQGQPVSEDGPSLLVLNPQFVE